jgi:radical SAM superfamily enzyme YgiQ (UPF0313 family)
VTPLRAFDVSRRCGVSARHCHQARPEVTVKKARKPGPHLEFFAIASSDMQGRFSALFKRDPEIVGSDLMSLAALPIGSDFVPALPALFRALALRPQDKAVVRPFLCDAMAQVVGLGGGTGPFTEDAAWTWIEAWIAHSSTSEEFVEAFNSLAVRRLFHGSFLINELARATVLSCHSDRSALFLGPAVSLLLADAPLSGGTATSFGASLARLVYGATPNTVTSPISLALTEACMCAGVAAFEAFHAQAEICTAALEAQQQDRHKQNARPKEVAAAIALFELSDAVAARNCDIQWSEPAELRWRCIHGRIGDVIDARLVDEAWSVLATLASDSDVLIRCAAAMHAIALTTRLRPPSKAAAHDIREQARSCVLRTSEDCDHHWLRGATIAAHCDAASFASEDPELGLCARWTRPSIASLNVGKDLRKPADRYRAALCAQVDRFLASHRRIALVLPSITPSQITTPSTERHQSNKGSPPLGLGQIASYLAANGHFVQLFDAHRYSFDELQLAVELATFDVVGLSIVFSTMRSAASLIAAIRNVSRGEGPTIVVGGHAPTLITFERIQQAGIGFDYLVIGPGEEAFGEVLQDVAKNSKSLRSSRVIGGTSVPPQPGGRLANNRELASLRSSSSKQYQSFIEGLPWIDRTFFADPLTGQAYEPSPTRNGVDVEAHLVLSRGCDWRCTFCTEALIAGRNGENRRSVEDIAGEIEHLQRHHSVNRIQFIDDNVFPTLPARKRRADGAVALARVWAERLLGELRRIGSAGQARNKLKWRGLMRVEDFLLYEELLTDFVPRLADSGCNLLAFGLECGSEQLRAKMKGADEHTATNDEIIALVTRLRGAGIFVKGYFILGGPGQTKADAEDTIGFSLAANLDLAYFAIYKDFRGIAQSVAGDPTRDEAASLRFQLFPADILDEASILDTADEWEQQFGSGIPRDCRADHSVALRELQDAGFSFNDLVRYNDYHEWVEPYEKMGFLSHKDYLQTLSDAYLRFYARRAWIPRYRALVHGGY